MLARDKAAIRIVVKALHVKRTRGRLDPDSRDYKDLDALLTSYVIPHGGYDIVDKACMLLQAIIGDTPVSILDDGTQDGKGGMRYGNEKNR